MANGRFSEVACELTGERSPDEIREEELQDLITKHISDYKREEFTESDAGVVYRKIYDDPNGCEEAW